MLLMCSEEVGWLVNVIAVYRFLHRAPHNVVRFSTTVRS